MIYIEEKITLKKNGLHKNIDEQNDIQDVSTMQFAHSVNLRQRIQRMLRTSFTFQFQKTCIGTFCVKISQPRISLIVDERWNFILKYIPHKADVAPIYILIKHSQSSGSKYFSQST